jgi:hypothetical protein
MRWFALALVIACTPRATPTTTTTSSASATTSASVAPAPWPGVPGVVIAHSPASSKAFVGSPSLAILPDGTYVASHDLFGPGTQWRTTNVFASTDKGKTWSPASSIDGMLWGSLFVQNGALHIIGTDGHYGHVVLRRSRDDGKTWSPATVLRDDGKFHCAPVPVVEHAGRVWRAFEQQSDPVRWPEGFRAMMMSAPASADLLDAKSWTSSDARASDATWLDGSFNGWLEGNAVVAPDGHVVDVLRVDVDDDGPERAALVHISDDGKTTSFDPRTGFVAFPGGATKFTIRFDPISKMYWTLSNYVPVPAGHTKTAATRNTLALVASVDLATWNVRTVLLHHADRRKHAFQYVDWQFDGDDIVAVARTAFEDGAGGADTYHNANFLTFHRFARFRDLSSKDSVPIAQAAPLAIDVAEFSARADDAELAPLAVHEDAFSNRDYTWQTVPARFAGWRFTRLAGGEKTHVTVTAKRATTIYAMTHGTLAGWDPVPDGDLTYDDRKRSRVRVFQRHVDAGQTLDIAQSAWSGTMLLVPAK